MSPPLLNGRTSSNRTRKNQSAATFSRTRRLPAYRCVRDAVRHAFARFTIRRMSRRLRRVGRALSVYVSSTFSHLTASPQQCTLLAVAESSMPASSPIPIVSNLSAVLSSSSSIITINIFDIDIVNDATSTTYQPHYSATQVVNNRKSSLCICLVRLVLPTLVVVSNVASKPRRVWIRTNLM